jgi:hypothetical protein
MEQKQKQTLGIMFRNSAEEKNAQNSVPYKKNGSKLSEFRYKTFSGREKGFGIPLCGTKIQANFRNSFLKHLMTFEVRINHVVKLFWLFLRTNFSYFCAVPFQALELTLPLTLECL